MPPKEGEQSGKSGTLAGMRDAMKKATTEMLILFLLRQKEMYVYEMIREMARLTDGVLTFNTLYLAIYRLQEREQIRESERRIVDGRARAYFSITMYSPVYPRLRRFSPAPWLTTHTSSQAEMLSTRRRMAVCWRRWPEMARRMSMSNLV